MSSNLLIVTLLMNRDSKVRNWIKQSAKGKLSREKKQEKLVMTPDPCTLPMCSYDPWPLYSPNVHWASPSWPIMRTWVIIIPLGFCGVGSNQFLLLVQSHPAVMRSISTELDLSISLPQTRAVQTWNWAINKFPPRLWWNTNHFLSGC